MRPMTFRILLSYSALWPIWNFIWITTVFYMSVAPAWEHFRMVAPAVGLWIIGLTIALVFLFVRVRSLDATLARVDQDSVGDDELRRSAERCLNLPLHGMLLYIGLWIVLTLMIFAIWRLDGMGMQGSLSTFVGGSAGLLATPWTVFGVFSLITGPAVTRFVHAAHERGLEIKAIRMGVGTKMAWMLITFALGFGCWLGGMGYYTGVREIVTEIKGTELQRHKYINSLLPTDATPAEIIDRLRGSDPRVTFFFADHQGRVIISEKGFAVYPEESPRFNQMVRSKMSAETGAYYDHVTERVFAWTPRKNSKLVIGSIAPIESHLGDLRLYWIWLGIFAIAALGTAAVLSYTFAAASLRSVNALNAMIGEVGRESGRIDLMARGNVVSLDEVGVLAMNINRLQEQLTGIVLNIRSVADATAASGTRIADTAESLREGAQDQTASVEEASAGMEEMAATMDGVSNRVREEGAKIQTMTATLENLGESIREVASRAETVLGRSVESLEHAREAENASRESIEGIRLIEKSSGDIMKILQVINEISDRTNLLSLNASIEAARAGDAGRGFAVVAEEISRLADQSTGATKEIEQLVATARASIADGSEKVRRVDELIGNMKQAAEATGDMGRRVQDATSAQLKVSGEITNSIQGLNRAVETVTTAGTEQARASQEMTRSLEQINSVTMRNSEGAEEIARSLAELNEEMKKLTEVVRLFHVE